MRTGPRSFRLEQPGKKKKKNPPRHRPRPHPGTERRGQRRASREGAAAPRQPGPARPRGEAEGLAQGHPVTKPALREVPKVPPKPPAGPSGWAGRGTRGWPRGGRCQKAAPGCAQPLAARPFTSTPLNPLLSLPGTTPYPRATKPRAPCPFSPRWGRARRRPPSGGAANHLLPSRHKCRCLSLAKP